MIMRRLAFWGGLLLMLAATSGLAGCGGSVSAHSGAVDATLPTPTATATAAATAAATEVVVEDLSALTPEPTEPPDPVATEYAQAMLATPAPARTSTPTGQATLDLLKLLEAHANQAALPPPPDQVNGQPIASFVVMDAGVVANIKEIFAKGQAAGRNPHAFSKAGDSTIETPYFLARFDGSPYKLGAYAYLQAVIDNFNGSFARASMAVRIGQHSWTVLNPAWADKAQCEPGESPLGCEFRQNNPSILLIRLGANDAGVPKYFEQNMRAVVQFALDNNVIPVLSTKPDQRRGTEGSNDILRKLAAEYKIPLWDFDHVAATMPNRGLGPDGVHMTGFYEHDYTLPQAFQRGQGVQNLTALIVLDQVWKALQSR